MNTTQETFWSFVEFDDFYTEFAPLTPYGKAQKRVRPFLATADSIELALNRTEALFYFIASHPENATNIAAALKNIPQLPQCGSATMDQTDLFLVKKFITNVHIVYAQLPDTLRAEFSFPTPLTDLAKALSTGQTVEDTFYLSDSYDTNLATVREKIRALDGKSKKVRANFLAEVEEQTGLDFRFRDFLVASHECAPRHPAVSLEPFDGSHLVVRPIWPDAILEQQRQREALICEEQTYEERVRESLSQAIHEQSSVLDAFVNSLTTFDFSMAQAQIARKYNMIRPRIGNAPRLTEARFLPVERICLHNQSAYTPLTWALTTPVSVVFGSNMGGKTVALKTLGFLQLLTQMGFFVPASEFITEVFVDLIFVGQNSLDKVDGLSSFGLEIHSFVQRWQNAKYPCLLLVDEFARTTNSTEATALLSALLHRFAAQSGVRAAITTHFLDLSINRESTSLFRMMGFARDTFKRTALACNTEQTLTERIRLINTFMRYEIEKVQTMLPTYDALCIAEMLGLDSDIVNNARQLSAHQPNRGEE